MPEVTCPTCGGAVPLPPEPPRKNKWLGCGLGCLAVVLAIPFMVATMGVLAAIAIPNFLKARECSQRNVCMSNLRMLKAAQEQHALERGGAAGDGPDVNEAITAVGRELHCPNGGSYTLSSLGAEPACSVHGNLSSPYERKALRLRPTKLKPDPEPEVEK